MTGLACATALIVSANFPYALARRARSSPDKADPDSFLAESKRWGGKLSNVASISARVSASWRPRGAESPPRDQVKGKVRCRRRQCTRLAIAQTKDLLEQSCCLVRRTLDGDSQITHPTLEFHTTCAVGAAWHSDIQPELSVYQLDGMEDHGRTKEQASQKVQEGKSKGTRSLQKQGKVHR